MKQPAFLLLLCAALLPAGLLFAQFTNVQVSTPGSASPNELTVALNPTNLNFVAAGANIRYFYVSSNGGMTWTQSLLPPGTSGDPSVAYDANGMLYYAHLMPGLARLAVHRSSNNGASWMDSVTVGYNPPKHQDKEWLVADQTLGAYRNRLYMAWTEFDRYGSADPADSTRILFAWSNSGGAAWSTPVRLNEQAGNCLDMDSTVEGAVPAVGPQGQVYVSWAGPRGIEFDRSTDGGVTFGNDIPVTPIPGGWDFAVPGIFRANGLPVTGCDAGGSPFSGRVYIVWSDQRNGPDNTDVFIVHSTDQGSTWSAVKRVNDDITNRHQFFPWLSVDPVTGYLYVVFYDRRETAGNATDVELAKSTDGGETFTNVQISSSFFVPGDLIFFGDYIGMAALNRKVVPVWMRMDNMSMSVWAAPIADIPSSAGSAEAPPDAFVLEQNYPNPFNPSTTITYTLPHAGHVTLRITDPLGREVALLEDHPRAAGKYAVLFDGSRLASGVYLCILKTGGTVRTRAMTLVR